MKKISFVAAILASAALAGACHKNKPADTTPTGNGSAMGSDMGSGAGSAPAGGDAGSAAGSGGM